MTMATAPLSRVYMA